ncbi:MAG: hypothetical protein JNL90_08165 [Planctomycetes bacterium]|nr:hypothetical protein [Planctomycetota bacterium]
MTLSRPRSALAIATRRTIGALPLALALLFGGAGCQAPSAGADGATDADEAASPRTLAALRRAVEVARAKLVLLELEQVEAQAKRDAEIAAAMWEEMAATTARLANHERAAPLARAEAEHALEESRTAVHDAEEELVQLKLMYAEQDLADATRELVLARSERRLAAAKEAVTLEERKLQLLIEVEQPAAESALANKVLESAEAHRAARQDDELAKRAAALAHLEATHALAEAEEELREALGGDDSDDDEPAP